VYCTTNVLVDIQTLVGKYVATNVLVDIQTLVGKYVEIARNPTIIDSVIRGTDVSTLSFAPIGHLADNIVGNLTGMFQLLRPFQNFSTAPQYMFDLMQIKPKAAAAPAAAPGGQAAPPSTPAKRGDRSKGSQSKSAKSSPGSSPGSSVAPSLVSSPESTTSATSPATAKAKAVDSGLFEFIKDKPEVAPSFGFTIANPMKKGTVEYPCPAYFFKGFSCQRGKCKLVHIGWAKLSPADQAQFQSYVDGHKDTVQFAVGQAPPGTK
jgi:hypothetical protein